MFFSNRIKQLREQNKLLQRQVAAALDMDNAMYCKIERGDRQMKRSQVILLSKILKIDESELLNLWLADKVYGVVSEEDDPDSVLNLVCDNLIEYKRSYKK